MFGLSLGKVAGVRVWRVLVLNKWLAKNFKNKEPNLPIRVGLGSSWRRVRDSNPRKLALQRFSRPPLSTAQPTLHFSHRFLNAFYIHFQQSLFYYIFVKISNVFHYYFAKSSYLINFTSDCENSCNAKSSGYPFLYITVLIPEFIIILVQITQG